MIERGDEPLVRYNLLLPLVDESFMTHPLYPIPNPVPSRNFLDRHKAGVSQHKLPFRDTSKNALLPHEPLGMLVHILLRHTVDERSHPLVTVYPRSVFLQSVFLSREPVHNAGLNGAVIGVEERH